MQSLFRRTTRLARPSSFLIHPNRFSVRRYTSQSYSGDDISSQTEADASKLKANVERPSLKDTISSLSSSSSSESKNKEMSTSSHVETSHGGSPAIEDWRSAHEKVQKLLDQISDSDDPGSTFISLDSQSQQLLFDKLRIRLLREADGKWRLLWNSCPHTDLQIHSITGRREPDGGEDEQHGYDQKKALLDQWSYFNDELDGGTNRGIKSSINRGKKSSMWSDFNLYSESPDSDLKLCDDWDPLRLSFDNAFFQRVSSQLLLYRLTATFGMPPPVKTDDYKCCWHINLRLKDGCSQVEFSDRKGAAAVFFWGTTEASSDAVKLVNFLVGMNCLHPYDGTLAGTMG